MKQNDPVCDIGGATQNAPDGEARRRTVFAALRPFALTFRAAFACGSVLAAGLLLGSCAGAPPPLRIEEAEGGNPGYARIAPFPGMDIFVNGFLDSDGTLQAESVTWFTNWRDGWTEANISASGSLRVEGSGKEAKLAVVEPVAFVSVESARIRYRDRIIYGDEAARLLERRILRAETAALALLEAFNGRHFPSFTAKKKSERPASFEYAAGQYLFPERYGYPEGSKPSPKNAENRTRGEGLEWDTGYTGTIDPQLAEVRDSGTLWRDWEECAGLFYFIYQMERQHE